MILAIIPARAGSKRLPGKNTMSFGGRPLLAWSVALARRLDRVVRCVVSTEDAGIARVAREAGADVIERPEELAGDESSMTAVLVHAAETVRSQGERFEGVLLLQPTNPLRPVEMMERAISRFLAEPCDSMMAVSRRPLKLGRVVDGVFLPNYAADSQSRHMAPAYYENGLFYLSKADVLLGQNNIYGSRILAFETERPFDDIDIDEPMDLVIGEAVLSAVRHRLDY